MNKKFKTGDFWLSRNYKVAEIQRTEKVTKKHIYHIVAIFWDEKNAERFSANGDFNNGVVHPLDLMKKITPETDPEYFI